MENHPSGSDAETVERRSKSGLIKSETRISAPRDRSFTGQSAQRRGEFAAAARVDSFEPCFKLGPAGEVTAGGTYPQRLAIRRTR